MANFPLSAKRNRFKQGAISHLSNDQHGRHWKITATGKQDSVELKSGPCCWGVNKFGYFEEQFGNVEYFGRFYLRSPGCISDCGLHSTAGLAGPAAQRPLTSAGPIFLRRCPEAL